MPAKNRSVYGPIPGVDKLGRNGHSMSVSFRHFFAILFAVAMIFAPLAMPGGQAMAAPIASHHDEAVTADHCGGTSDQGKPGKAVDHGCCVATCLGIAMAPASPDDPLAYVRIAPRPSADLFRRGFLGEIATPPPRLA